MLGWIDTHCHLDAQEFATHRPDAREILTRCASVGVALCVIPAIHNTNFDAVRQLAQTHQQAYALGIHPLQIERAQEACVHDLDQHLGRYKDDAHLVALGEIGLDFFVPELCHPAMRERQNHLYKAQLKLAKKHQLPVLLHGRKSVDQLLRGLREVGSCGGIAHAFNGSMQQAMQFVEMGFALGFGGTVSFSRSLHIRTLARKLPAQAIVMETDAPDMPPQWLYTPARERLAGQAQGINSPLQLPRIGDVLAQLRGLSSQAWAEQTSANAMRVLPKLRALTSN